MKQYSRRITAYLPALVLMLSVAYISYWLLEALTRVGSNAVVMETIFFSDGQYQLLNPMRRIEAGLPFQYFHGKGVPYIHYPLYALTGKSLHSMELSRWLMSLITFVGSITVVAFALMKQMWLRAALIATVCLLGFSAGFQLFGGLVIPANSVLGVRTFMPLLFFAVFLLDIPRRRKAIMAGFTLGLTPLLGTEHGLALTAATVALVAGLVIVQIRIIKRVDVLDMGVFGGVFILTAALGFTLMSGGISGALETIRYNFVTVPQEQIWYFGSPPNAYMKHIRELLQIQLPHIRMALQVLIALLGVIAYFGLRILFGRWKQFSLFRTWHPAALLMSGYALASMLSFVLSYTAARFLSVPMRLLVILAFLIALDLLNVLRQRFGFRVVVSTPPQGMMRVAGLVGLAGGIAAFVLINTDYRKLFADDLAPIGDNLQAYLDVTTAYFDPIFLDDATGANDDPSLTIWADYTGVLHDRYDLFNPVDDYIIHALGPERRAQYVEAFMAIKPQYVETFRRDQFLYQDWLHMHHWDYYELLLLNYEPLLLTPHAIIWQRADAPWQAVDYTCESYPVEDKRFYIPDVIDVDDDVTWQIISARITYNVENPYEAIPFIGDAPRYLVHPNYTINGQTTSLPPYRNHYDFPIIFNAENESALFLDFVTHSITPDAVFNVERICLRDAQIPPERITALAEPSSISSQ